ncbi:TolC family protein [Pontiellaceae bacterium B12219]|nr:TolC family protein [Pontiellaceae bacterium B12219]
MKHIIVAVCGSMLAAVGFAESGKLTLDQALEQARIYSPELRAARLNTQAAEKAAAASGRWKNPNLLFEAENFGGDLNGFDDTEYTVGIEQTFERGGKLKKSRAVAEKSIGMAFQAEAEKEIALLANVRLAFIEVLAQQEIGMVRAKQEELGRAFLDVATRRHNTGGSSELEVIQAELALEEILLAQAGYHAELKAARIRLASLMGVAEHTMPELEGNYYTLQPLEDAVIADGHPALQRLEAEIAMKRAMAAQAKARDAADITLAAGYRYDAGFDLSTFVMGASMPLNFVRAGKAEQAATLMQADTLQAEEQELRRKLQQDLSMLIAVYSGAKREAEITRDKLMPKAERAYELSQAGYEAGRYSWFEPITSQQQLAEIRIRQIEALKNAHMARAEITRFMKEGM